MKTNRMNLVKNQLEESKYFIIFERMSFESDPKVYGFVEGHLNAKATAKQIKDRDGINQIYIRPLCSIASITNVQGKLLWVDAELIE